MNGLLHHLQSVQGFLQDNFDFLNYDNCSIQSQTIFNGLLSESRANGMGVIIGFSGTPVRNSQSSEFGSTLVVYKININIFGVLVGTDEEVDSQILSVYEFFDNLLDLYKNNSTMNGQVMDFAFDRSEEPMIYPRDEDRLYLMLTTYWLSKDNL